MLQISVSQDPPAISLVGGVSMMAFEDLGQFLGEPFDGFSHAAAETRSGVGSSFESR